MTRIKSKVAMTGFAIMAGMSLALSSVAPAYATYGYDADEYGEGTSHYYADLSQLNDSGVYGKAQLQYHSADDEDHLKINLRATGTTPDKTHPVHIHGNSHPEVAMCPTRAVDKNKDGFVSVIEGAATYGPIKLNLTSPQTPFGAGPTPALFTPFAGTPGPDNAFPMANANGKIHLNETYTFDSSEEARGALASLMPLEDQHIVVHGDMAPASVDADAFAALGAPVTGDMNAVVYDALLPIACGEIVMSSEGDATDKHAEKKNSHKNADSSQHQTNPEHQPQADNGHTKNKNDPPKEAHYKELDRIEDKDDQKNQQAEHAVAQKKQWRQQKQDHQSAQWDNYNNNYWIHGSHSPYTNRH